jgi:DNA-damage-inducible protein J
VPVHGNHRLSQTGSPVNGIPFELRFDPFYSAQNMATLRASVREANEGKLTAHELIEE